MAATQRDAQQSRSEIEHARDQLAGTVDLLADRLAPKRLVDEMKSTIKAKVSSPTGKAVIGASAIVVSLIVIRNFRRSRRR